jgi:succinoglycan biosynthesis transport protein ExoP
MNKLLLQEQSEYRSGLALLRDVFVWRNRTILGWMAISLLLSVLWLIYQPSRYTAKAELLLDTRSLAFGAEGQTNATVDASFVETQLETLKSDAIAIAVMDSMGLWKDPEFHKTSGLLTRVLGLFSTSDESRPERQATLNSFKRWLSVRRVGRSYVAEVSFSALNPKRAADIANALANAYLDDLFQAKNVNSERANAWMLRNSSKLREEENKAEQAVEDFKAADLQQGGILNRKP